ncbi:MAG: hypothetical protein BWY77_01698 [bacterium ADurb.Bin431]|nr:MAG: hypothetical protein BWY77_01698 [bacterium ADurb.Bin431]
MRHQKLPHPQRCQNRSPLLHQRRQQAQKPDHPFLPRRTHPDRRRRRTGQRHHRLRLPHLLRLQGRPLHPRPELQPQIRRPPHPLLPRRQLHRLLLRNPEQPGLPRPRTAPQQFLSGRLPGPGPEQHGRWRHHRLQPQQPRQRQRNPGRPRLLARPVHLRQALLPLRLLHPALQGGLPSRAEYPPALLPAQQQRLPRPVGSHSRLLVALQHVRPHPQLLEIRRPRQTPEQDSEHRI